RHHHLRPGRKLSLLARPHYGNVPELAGRCRRTAIPASLSRFPHSHSPAHRDAFYLGPPLFHSLNHCPWFWNGYVNDPRAVIVRFIFLYSTHNSPHFFWQPAQAFATITPLAWLPAQLAARPAVYLFLAAGDLPSCLGFLHLHGSSRWRHWHMPPRRIPVLI